MRDLSEIRVDIDSADSALKEFFVKRMELVEQVAEEAAEPASIEEVVAAEEENIRTIDSGTNCAGKPIYEVILPILFARKSRKPDALKIPTATINPTSVGIILITVTIPFLAPFTNSS